jgi:hypothetical protein
MGIRSCCCRHHLVLWFVVLVLDHRCSLGTTVMIFRVSQTRKHKLILSITYRNACCHGRRADPVADWSPAFFEPERATRWRQEWIEDGSAGTWTCSGTPMSGIHRSTLPVVVWIGVREECVSAISVGQDRAVGYAAGSLWECWWWTTVVAALSKDCHSHATEHHENCRV